MTGKEHENMATRIVKPNVNEAALAPLADFVAQAQRCIDEGDSLTGNLVTDVTVPVDEELEDLTCAQTVFEQCNFAGCSLKQCSFTDVIFRLCDFSNCDMTGGYFCRCELYDCKGSGAKFNESGLNQVAFVGGAFRYASFDRCRLDHVTLSHCDWSEAYVTGCFLRNFEPTESDLIRTTFFQTPLRNVNLSESRIDGIILSNEYRELRGAIVNAHQAAMLAQLLGVTVV